MKVILLEDVKGTGKKGQTIEASDGHAKNFLIPRKLAVAATKENLNTLEMQKRAEEKRRREELEAAQQQKEIFEAKTIKITVKSGVSDKIFGSVTNKEIATAFEQQTGIKIDKKKIVLDEPIKTKGQKQVDVRLHPQVVAKIKIEIE